jgi:rhamnulokinase
MSKFYVACELGADCGRVMLGTLTRDELTVSEARRFKNVPLYEKNNLHWNVPSLFEETLAGLRAIGEYEEPIDGISCTSWGSDYMLFDSNDELISPTFHKSDARSEEGMRRVLSKVPWETAYNETGTHKVPGTTLFQLGAEKSGRLRKAKRLLPVADAFNYLLGGVARVEASQACTTQLYNPAAKNWSNQMLDVVGLSPRLLPAPVDSGARLGELREEIARDTKLQETQVVASCSHQIAAAVAGLPVELGESWAFLQPGSWSVIGTQLPEPLISPASRELNFTNEVGYGGSVSLYKQSIGLFILEECLRFWEGIDRTLEPGLLSHLAISSPAFESLINVADPRFHTPGDMPMKIQAFCKETDQTVPRKPGPIYRCILESLALHYRKLLQELEFLGGEEITHIYLLGGHGNMLFNHFIANALQLPVTITSADSIAIGNIVVQALTLGHLRSLEQARSVVRHSFKRQTICPRATPWEGAYNRMVELTA